MRKNAARNPAIKSTAIKYLLALALLAFASSCGGGGGGSGSSITNPNYGAVEGYVYAPVGSARVAEAAPAGYMAVSGASVSISCGGSSKNTTTNSSGYFKVTSLPVGNCKLTATKSGYGSFQTNTSITDNDTTTVGGSGGILLSPSTSGSIKVTANVSGGEVIIDGKETNINLPQTLSYTFDNIAPGQHTVGIILAGYDSVSGEDVTVNAGETKSVHFNLNPIGNHAPVANAGSDAKGFTGYAFTYQGWNGTTQIFTPYEIYYTLNGSASSDQDGDNLVFNWVQLSGPSVTLDNASASQPRFIPKQEGSYEFALKMNDGHIDSATDTVTIDIAKPTGKLVFQSAMPQVSFEIYTWSLDSDSYTMLTERSYDDTNPAWSPDGGKIVYVCDPAGYTEICMINSDGSGYARLTNNTEPDITPDFSNNGLKAVYATGGLASAYGIFTMNLDGSNQTAVLNTANWIFAPEYSPDGSKILFIADYGSDNYEIMVVNSDGSNMARLTNNTTTEFYFAWMPDGRILYTSSNFLGDRIRHLYTINPDGTNRQEILIPSNVVDINGPTVSSDGRFIFFSDDDGYLWVMYADGSAAMSYGLGGSSPDYHPGP